MTARPIRVLLAEDQGMMRGALALLPGMEDDIEVVAQVAAGDAILDAALAHGPDVALLDIELPGAVWTPRRTCAPGSPTAAC